MAPPRVPALAYMQQRAIHAAEARARCGMRGAQMRWRFDSAVTGRPLFAAAKRASAGSAESARRHYAFLSRGVRASAAARLPLLPIRLPYQPPPRYLPVYRHCRHVISPACFVTRLRHHNGFTHAATLPRTILCHLPSATCSMPPVACPLICLLIRLHAIRFLFDFSLFFILF